MTPTSRHKLVRRPAKYLAAVTFTALACCLSPASAGAAAGAIVPTVRATGGNFAGVLNDVTCVTAADCWAVGFTDAQRAVAEHWNGTAWAMVPVASPHGAMTTWLPSVSCASRTDCWAVGQYFASTGRNLAYAEHWNGRAWSPVPVRTGSGTLVSLLLSVSCPSTTSCWAVGSDNPAGALIEHWNGHTWTSVSARGLGAGANAERVACGTANDCWLTGLRIPVNANGSSGTLLGHWTGGAWTAVRTPTSRIHDDALSGIFCRATACMAVGSHRNFTLAQRWNGSGWTVTPTGTDTADLGGVSCINPGNCMAVGTTGGNGKVFSERWIGGRWHVVQAPTPTGGIAARLGGIACVSTSDCWGVGSYLPETASRDSSLMQHWNGRAWSIVS